LGSRLGEQVRDTPKPLITVAGEPFVLHQLRLLAAAGAQEVVLCVGYLGERIEETIGDERFGIRIRYSYDGPGLDGTLGAIRRALPLLGQRFLTLYGDTYLRVDYAAFDDSWGTSGLPGAMAVLRNAGQWDVSNAVFSEDLVTEYNKSVPSSEMKWIDYGLGGLTREALDMVSADRRDLSDLQQELAQRHLLHGYEATARFYEIGTPNALRETDVFLSQNRSSEING
jgi:NDP-sugar pyrophosphorylase family protein